jgi:Leucine-rich repeat (LRR) protein
MKKMLAVVLAIVMFCSLAFADSLEELTQRRQELFDELDEINETRGRLIREAATTPSDETLGRIIDLFPDEELAKLVRDACGKYSIEETVTVADLQSVESLSLSVLDIRQESFSIQSDVIYLSDLLLSQQVSVYQAHDDIHDLTGIGYLANLRTLDLTGKFDGTTLPDDMRNCTSLTSINLNSCIDLVEIPEWIGELENLEYIDLSWTSIQTLPESTGHLLKLHTLIVRNCHNLTTLPLTIGNCQNLRYLDIAYTAITVLPISIWNLDIEDLDMRGTPIQ